MSIRLSIIIPFYNVEQYIAQCLDSVFNQDIPENEYEVICVNDASPDNSREIVINYQTRHPNLILVEHGVNKRLGAARNTGRRIARGNYIWNVDSDDMIMPNCLGSVLCVCEQNELDVFLFSFNTLEGGKIHTRRCPWKDSSPVISGLSFWKNEAISHQSQGAQVWTQVYRRDFLDKANIYSPEINMGEDVSFTYRSILSADRFLTSIQPYYVWRRNDSSLMATLVKEPSPASLYESSYISGKLLYHTIDCIPKSEIIVRDSIRRASAHMIIKSWKSFNTLSPSSRNEFVRLIRKDFFKNLYVFKILGKKQCVRYIKLLLFGRILSKDN